MWLTLNNRKTYVKKMILKTKINMTDKGAQMTHLSHAEHTSKRKRRSLNRKHMTNTLQTQNIKVRDTYIHIRYTANIV